MTQRQVFIPNQYGRLLGRHVNHDERSKEYVAEVSEWVVDTYHPRDVLPFDQGSTGSCTGNAMAGLLVSSPMFNYIWLKSNVLTEEDAVNLYTLATEIDPWPGSYPPDDTGSDGLSVAKAAVRLGYIKHYRHAFGLNNALKALTLKPVMTGVNWYEGFDHPDTWGKVSITGEIRGGHEFEVLGIDIDRQLVRAVNSWGLDWGDKGYFDIAWEDWDRLLNEQGDVTVVHK